VANKDRDAVQTGLNDLLGSVIKNDQRSAGRQSREQELEPAAEVPDFFYIDKATTENVSPNYDSNTDNNVSPQYDNMTSKQYDKQTNVVSNKRADEPQDEQGEKGSASFAQPSHADSKKKTPTRQTTSALLQARLEEVEAMSEDAKITVTLRIPAAFNEWLDEYVHRSWPVKVKKQDLVVEALQLLYARRGSAGEEVIPTELLDEKKR